MEWFAWVFRHSGGRLLHAAEPLRQLTFKLDKYFKTKRLETASNAAGGQQPKDGLDKPQLRADYLMTYQPWTGKVHIMSALNNVLTPILPLVSLLQHVSRSGNAMLATTAGAAA